MLRYDGEKTVHAQGGGKSMSEQAPESATNQATRARVVEILAAFNGKVTAITEAGRENMRTVNRLSRIIALRHVALDKTFRHNISRYRTDALEDDILIGARRDGAGGWSLVAELVPRSDDRR
jgi:hypothetical protein